MKATDLMIGDWVLISVWDCNPFQSKVTSVNYNSYRGEDYEGWIDTEDEEEIGMYNVQPIPLTPEILEKNRFKARISYIKDKLNNEYALVVDDEKEIIWYKGIVYYKHYEKADALLFECKYVHILQHFLRLCGIDKEIVL